MSVSYLDRTRVAGEGTEGIALGGDAEPLPRRAIMHHGEQVQIGALRGIEQVGLHVHHLVQVARHERDGVDRALRKRGVPADTLGEDARATLAGILERDAIRIGLRSGKLGQGHDDDALGLAGDGVGRLGAAPRANDAALDLRALERAAKAALLGIAHGELGIGSKEEQWLLMTGQVVLDVGHAHLLVAAEQRTERVARRDALTQEERTGIERQHGGALVIDHTAAEQPALTTLHGKRVGIPTRPSGNDIDMRDGGDLLFTLARDVCDSDIAVIVGRLVPQALGDAQAAIERVTHGSAERSARFGRRGVGDGRICHQGGDVGNDILPDFIDVFLNALHNIHAHGRSLPSGYSAMSNYAQ